MNSVLHCPKCGAALTESRANRADLSPCPTCGSLLQVEVFPALFRPKTPGRDGEVLLVEGEASCFYHPQKKALLPCESCGRFLCGLCDCELHGRHFCPTCLETGKKKGRIKNLENERTLYDSIALALAIYPLLIFYFTVITAPMALYIALRRWNAPRSIIHRTKIRLVLAIILASAQIAGWGLGLYFLIARSHG
jgi:hypothetical protein